MSSGSANLLLYAVLFSTTVEPSGSFILPRHNHNCDLNNYSNFWNNKKKLPQQQPTNRSYRQTPLILTTQHDDNEDLIKSDPEETSVPVEVGDNDEPEHSAEDSSEEEEPSVPICRIVTRSDAKIPPALEALDTTFVSDPYYRQMLDKMDIFYHAESRIRTKQLKYFQSASNPKTDSSSKEDPTGNNIQAPTGIEKSSDSEEEERKLVSHVRTSLEDAGFELLSQRDLDLSESLNAGYLLGLSILPDLKNLDPELAQEFYPEKFSSKSNNNNDDPGFLFDGRVLVYWRGYSEERTEGRLVLQKLDYLQASIVQRSAQWIRRRGNAIESDLLSRVGKASRFVSLKLKQVFRRLVKRLPSNAFTVSLQSYIVSKNKSLGGRSLTRDKRAEGPLQSRFKLSRYGGSKVKFVGSGNADDALDPFTICEVNYEDEALSSSSTALQDDNISLLSKNATFGAVVEHDIYQEVNRHTLTCEYDAKMSPDKPLPPMQLLRRVGISNLIDVFTAHGRDTLVQTLTSKSELVEPTYEEVVVVWRPMEKQKKRIRPPKIVSEFADMFDVEGFEAPPIEETVQKKGRLAVRNFENVPMANLPAVMPKTKLVFRPADAFLFDTISFFTFLLVVSSVKLDSPKLDLLALVSGVLWIVRTTFRYSNKLARYDLLVKTFLTSKISHRNSGAIKYLTSEAGSQRAIRAGLVHFWLWENFGNQRSADGDVVFPSIDFIVQNGASGINEILGTDKQIDINVLNAVMDLEDLGLVSLDSRGMKIVNMEDPKNSQGKLETSWSQLLEGKLLGPGLLRQQKNEQTRKVEDELKASLEKSSGRRSKEIMESLKLAVAKGEELREKSNELRSRLVDKGEEPTNQSNTTRYSTEEVMEESLKSVKEAGNKIQTYIDKGLS